MPVQHQQPYTPLVESEIKAIQTTLNKNPDTKKLTARVISQLRTQEHYNELQHAHRKLIHKSTADTLRDIADEVDSLNDKIDDLEHERTV
jgi:predicted  nucleic acid-binding Zn-ribbon protein